MQRRMMIGAFMAGPMALALIALHACQSYEFVFQPFAERQQAHLHFVVQTPSKADILFMVDNSSSMLSKQTYLVNSFNVFLENLPQDTNYRIGIVSSDAHGFVSDCNSVTNPPEFSNPGFPNLGAKGNCNRPDVVLRRPHDGTRGRLIAAYDPTAFATPAADFCGSPNAQGPNADPNACAAALFAFNCLAPTGAFPNVAAPHDPNCLAANNDGARWVIDRAQIGYEAYANCCPKGVCVDYCVEPVTAAIVNAYFRSNIAGLGDRGFGWEEGLLSAMWAVGVNPEDSDDTTSVYPDTSYNLLKPCVNPNSQSYDPSFQCTATAPGAPNTYQGLDQNTVPWLRNGDPNNPDPLYPYLDPNDDALLAVLLVSDEQDCSMPEELMNIRDLYEEPTYPVTSVCYQAQAQAGFLDVSERMSNRLFTLKHDKKTQVAVGFIGGVQKTGIAPNEGSSAIASDCYFSPQSGGLAQSPNDCACVSGNADPRWCQFSTFEQTQLGSPLSATCDAFSGSRYIDFVNQIPRHTFESICRNDNPAVDPNVVPSTDPARFAPYGPILADFARIATLACFDLQSLRPSSGDPNLLIVRRAAAGTGATPSDLPMTSVSSTEQGWYYDPVNNKICLTGLDRTIGDVYDIYVLNQDRLDFTK